MTPERSDSDCEPRNNFLKLVLSSPQHFSAYRQLDAIERTHVSAVKTQDYWQYRRLQDLRRQQMLIDAPFRKAWVEVSAAFGERDGSLSPERGVEFLDCVERDWRVGAVLVASEVVQSPKAKEAFGYIKKLRQIDQNRRYSESTKANVNGYVAEMERLRREAETRGLTEAVSSLDQRVSEAVEKSGVIGPFGEQFVIESIENMVDNALKAGSEKRSI